MKEIKINIPEGFEVDAEKSDLLSGKIVFKELKEEYNKTWEDLIGTPLKKENVYITSLSTISCLNISESKIDELDRNTFVDEKTAKAALAMAQISMLMPYYGGKITTEEWENIHINKYGLIRFRNQYRRIIIDCKHEFLSFHTAEQCECFLKHNEQLVKDYLMIE